MNSSRVTGIASPALTKEEYRFSYLFISHDLSIVEYLCDRVAVMYLGKIVELAPRDLLYDRPAHPYTLSLFSAIPLLQVGKKQQRIILQGDILSPIHPPPWWGRCNGGRC